MPRRCTPVNVDHDFAAETSTNLHARHSVQGTMDVFADLRYAIRLLRKTPVFTIAAIGTLALGIGANTTIFSLVQTLLIRPLPYEDPERVVMVWEDRTAEGFPGITKRLSEQYPESNRDFAAASVIPIREQILGDSRIQVIALMSAAAAIVLIACANLASLLLARASVRRGEYAVRLSLGATRGRLV